MLHEEKGVILPGAPNALAARIIADLGFKAVYLTGAGLTNTHFGLPDRRSILAARMTEIGAPRENTRAPPAFRFCPV
jgi:2-methylisocitrate lyase-like PEP mutase family enzyme